MEWAAIEQRRLRHGMCAVAVGLFWRTTGVPRRQVLLAARGRVRAATAGEHACVCMIGALCSISGCDGQDVGAFVGEGVGLRAARGRHTCGPEGDDAGSCGAVFVRLGTGATATPVIGARPAPCRRIEG